MRVTLHYHFSTVTLKLSYAIGITSRDDSHCPLRIVLTLVFIINQLLVEILYTGCFVRNETENNGRMPTEHRGSLRRLIKSARLLHFTNTLSQIAAIGAMLL